MIDNTINNIITALSSDPIYLIIAVIISAVIIYSLIKKLIKLSIYVIAIGVIYLGFLYFTGKELPKNIDDVENIIQSLVQSVTEKFNEYIINKDDLKDTNND